MNGNIIKKGNHRVQFLGLAIMKQHGITDKVKQLVFVPNNNKNIVKSRDREFKMRKTLFKYNTMSIDSTPITNSCIPEYIVSSIARSLRCLGIYRQAGE